MQEHTSAVFENELRELKDRLLMMGSRVEQLILSAIRALSQQNRDLAHQVESTDRQINADELFIDELCVRILALRQPLGRDLRFILTALKVNTDLERIGDEAVNIAERAGELCALDRLPGPHAHLDSMAQVAAGMLRDALDAFVDENGDRAEGVLVQDDVVDEWYGRILEDCRNFMAEDPENIAAGMKIASCARYLERIGDHATNIAEMVVYLARGEDVRHKFKR